MEIGKVLYFTEDGRNGWHSSQKAFNVINQGGQSHENAKA